MSAAQEIDVAKLRATRSSSGTPAVLSSDEPADAGTEMVSQPELPASFSSSVKLSNTVTIDYAGLELQDLEQIFEEDEEQDEDIKVYWNIRRTTEKPCLCCSQMCGCWIFLIILLAILGAVASSIEFSLSVPFYDRSEINQRREDAYAAMVDEADFLASFASSAEVAECVHQGPTILTRNGTLVQGPAPSKSCQRSSSMTLRLLYISKDRKTNILTTENLRKIQEIESYILNHPEWPRYCYLIDSSYAAFSTREDENLEDTLQASIGKEPNYTACERIFSTVNFLDNDYFDYDDETGIGYHLMAQDQYPQEFDFSQSNLDKVVTYWATYGYQRSYNLSEFPFAVATIGNQVAVQNYMFATTSGEYSLGDTEAIGLTSMLSLGLPIDGYNSASESPNDQYEDIGQWLWDEFDSFLKDAGFDGVDVYWSDSEQGMTNAEEGHLAIRSFSLFPFSIIGVLLYFMIMQDSFFLGIAGILQILLCFVPSLILYRYVIGEDYLGVLNIISFYIILGIGVDDMFVFTDQFYLTNEADFTIRMQKSYNKATRAMFTTSCTTFISFMSNASSVFPAVSTFGIFSAVLVLCNFLAVISYFPVVFSVYYTRFRHKRWDHPSRLFCCRKEEGEAQENTGEENDGEEGEESETKRDEKSGDEKSVKETEENHEDSSGLAKFFKNTWGPLVVRFRYIIVSIFIAILVVAAVIATDLEPDEEAPSTLPDGNNYQEYTDVLLEYFQKSENPTATKVRWIAGLDPDDPIDRSGTDDTNVTDYGSPNFLDCRTYDPTTPAAQVWSLKTCHDLFFSNVTDFHNENSDFGIEGEFGAKARNMVDDQIVPATDFNYYSKVVCFAQSFRDWLLTDNGCEKLQAMGLECREQMSARENCSLWDTEGNSCEPFPVPSASFGPLLENFLSDEAIDPLTQETFYDRFSDHLFVGTTPEEDSSVLQPDFSCRSNETARLTLFAISTEATTTRGFAMNYEDGIDLHNKWEAWSSQMRKFAPKEVASTYQSSSGSWSFYFLNETLLEETFRGIGLALFLGFVVLTLIGGNIVMAFLSVFTILLIVMDVFAFTVIAGYALGVIEAVLYVVVIGMSIDYSVHMSEAYTDAHGETRRDKVIDMVAEMGVSVLSGALSTLIASFFMFFAPNTFFTKFASFLFVTIALSCIYALVFFPAMLSIIGPLGNTGSLYFWIKRMKENFIHEMAKRHIQSKEFIRREAAKLKGSLQRKAETPQDEEES